MGDIANRVREELQRRVPVGTYNMSTGRTEQRPMDATDVKGMIDPVIDAVEELESRLEALEAR